MGALPKTSMAFPEFFSWWEKQSEDGRFELVDGHVYVMGRDRVGHNRAKLRAVNALQAAITAANLDCAAFTDGVGVSPNTRNFRLPDAAVNCGKVDDDNSVLPNPVIVVEIVSPSIETRDVNEKLTDYFAIKSVCHYLIIFPGRNLIVHHSRKNESDKIETAFVASGIIALSPPGISVGVADLLGEVSAT
jgi:Uma2 family endonuclease